MRKADSSLHAALVAFAQQVTEKTSTSSEAEPEDQLRSPFEALMRAVGTKFGYSIVLGGEARPPDLPGRPDFACA